MYKEFFRFDRYPFHNTPDPAFFYSSQGHREALASMVYGVEEGKGFTLVTGDVGTGKTMLVQALKNALGDRHLLIDICNPWITPEEVFESIRQRIKAPSATGEALFEGLKKRLLFLNRKGQRVVLVIDEAHQLPERTLEGIRLLSNIETPSEKLLQIILLGQDELADMLNLHSMRQVRQRIAMSFHLQRLDKQETDAYIQHRLRVAGGDPTLFPQECIDPIFLEAEGSPRVINLLCDSALLFAFGRKNPRITTELVQEAINKVRPERRKHNTTVDGLSAAADSLSQTDTAPPRLKEDLSSRNAVPGTAAEDELPFDLPAVDQPAPPRGTVRKAQWLIPGAMLVAGITLGAATLLVFQNLHRPELASGAKNDAAVPPNVEKKLAPSPASPRPESPAASNTTDPASAMQRPKVINPPASMMTTSPAAPPLPGLGEAKLPTQEVRIPLRGGLALLASNEFGAWNESVRDLIAAVNPGLTNLDDIPAGTSIQLPVINREALVVRDPSGRFHVYFGSFEQLETARQNLDAIRRTWPDAQLIPATRGELTVYRLFVGVFANRSDAIAVANALWFRYLPTLN